MERISKYQLFVLVMMEQIGSTNLWALGIEAKRDSWLVILFSLLVGCGFIWIFTELQRHFPEDNIAGISTSLLGRTIGWPLGLLYAAVEIFNSTRNSSEFTDLLNMTFLESTPPAVILLTFLSTIAYILFLKLETFTRVTEIVLPFTLIAMIANFILVIASGRADFSQLTPVLGEGIMPVLKASYPSVVNFPFALSFIFFQFWHHTSSQSTIRRATFSAVILSGLLIAFTQAIIVTTLGVPFATTSTIPILEVVRLISIGDFITNLDALGIILIFIGGFYMTMIHILAASMILSTLFRIVDYRRLLIPIGVFIFWYAGAYEPNYPFHVDYLKVQAWQQFAPLYNAMPILMLIIFFLKRYSTRSRKKT